MTEQTTVQIDRQDLLASAHSIEPLPASVARLAVLVADANANMKDITEVITYDQALTATLLRRANSVALGGSQTINTVHQAAVRLGPSALLSMALTTSVSSKMNRAIPAYGLKEGELWRNSVAASIAAETVRAKSPVNIPAEAPTAALLHDFGKVVLANHFGVQVLDMLSQAAKTEQVDLVDAEQAVFGATHADVGGIVAQQWKLPSTIVDGIVHHHATRGGLPPVCGAVSLAHLMSHEITHELSEEQQEKQDAKVEEYATVMTELRLEPSSYGALRDAARTRFEELSGRYGVI